MADMQWQEDGYECLEPEIGREIWRLDAPGLTADERRLFADHVEMCDACRLRQDMEKKIGQGLADGSLLLPSDLSKRTIGSPKAGNVFAQRVRVAGGMGGVALAASLALALILPPDSRDAGLIARSGVEPGFIRPVEGEVVVQRSLAISWDSIPGATAYKLSVEELNGEFTWQAETRKLFLTMPAEAGLPARREYRIQLTTIPEDLVQPGGVNVSFSTADFWSFIRYRMSAAAKPSRLLFWGGLATLLASTLGLGWRRS